MSFFYTQARKLGLQLTLLLSLAQTLIYNPAVQHRATSWWSNRVTILSLTLVNTVLTTTSEYVSRTTLAHAHEESKDQGFWVTDPLHGTTRLHHQTLINIIMTILATLVGGPIYFIRRRRNRFAFFMLFAFCSSIFAQHLASTLSGAVFTFAYRRLFFDLLYSMSIKYFMFELWRPLFIRFKDSIVGMGSVRVSQDLTTTFIKVICLNFLGFKG